MKKHWWHAFASFSPSPRNTTDTKASDDTLVGAGGRYSLRPSNLFSNRRSNSRGRKVRPSDVEIWHHQNIAGSSRIFSSSSPPEASPQPLPLPELQTLLRTDKRSASVNSASTNNVPLPSPRETERNDVVSNRATINDGAPTSYSCPRLISQDKSTPGNHRFRSVPASAPTSPRNSPVDTPPPHFQYMSPPSLFQVWSAPEMPSSDPTLVRTFAYPISSDAYTDNAPSFSVSKSPNGTLSPLSNRSSVEIALGRRDNNVHPLPLPPGASLLSSQPVIFPQPAVKVDIVPLKSQWQKGKLIGRGTFGSVYVASNKETGALCAMKEVEMLPDDPKSAECIKQLEQEIQVLSHLQHPNIVQYFGSEIVGDRFYIYLEYVHPGSLNKFISDHCGGITESVVRNFTRHILCGLAYLHSTKTIHRDIKGANLLVDAYGVVKLADFGMAKHLNGHAANLSLKGSPYWMAPELMQSGMHQDTNVDLAMAVDIWSLGCTIIEMFTGKPPWSEFEGAAAMFKVLQETPPIPENLSAEGKDFLGCCFRRNPAERASAAMLLEHRFLRNSHSADALSNSMERVKLKIDQFASYTDHK